MKRWQKVAGTMALGLACLLGASHWLIGRSSRLTPPVLPPHSTMELEATGPLTRVGRSLRTDYGGLTLAYLAGPPAELGRAHALLLRDGMIEVEGRLFRELETRMPWYLARTVLFDVAQLLFRRVDENFPPARRLELAASARAFRPDPYSHQFETYQRFLYLNALYDISLAFEESPLLGCTTFVLATEAQQAPLLARTFDFDVDGVFDEEKVVLLIAEDGKIPFLSVGWAGLGGVVSGMNLFGVAAVVHGARAGEPATDGEPTLVSVREVLAEATSVDHAARLFAARRPMVSHIVVVADVHGHAATLERVPGRPLHVRRLRGSQSVTNHFEGPAADDAKNQRILETSSTLPRLARSTALVATLPSNPTVDDAIRLLRDRNDAAGHPLPLGSRDAINGLIAGHGVVFDLERRVAWVALAPHLLGSFVPFDLSLLVATLPSAVPSSPLETRPPDPLLGSDEYRAWRSREDGKP